MYSMLVYVYIHTHTHIEYIDVYMATVCKHTYVHIDICYKTSNPQFTVGERAFTNLGDS